MIKSLVEEKNNLAFASIVDPRESNGLWEWRGENPAVFDIHEAHEDVQAMDIAPSGEAIAVYIYKSGEVRIYRGTIWSSLRSAPPQLRNVLFVRYRNNGELWVGTESGLYLHNRSSQRWRYWKHPFQT